MTLLHDDDDDDNAYDAAAAAAGVTYRVCRWTSLTGHAFNRLATPASTLTTAVISLPLTTQTIVTHCRIVRLSSQFQNAAARTAPDGVITRRMCRVSPTTDGVQSCGYVTWHYGQYSNWSSYLVRSIA